MPSKPKVTQSDVILFCRQFSTMIDAGLPIVQCLQILSSQEGNAAFGTVLQDILSSIEGKATLAEALQTHPQLFDSFFVSMVKAGESGGTLDIAMRLLSNQLESNAKRASQIKAAKTYTTVMALTAVATIGVVLAFVIPLLGNLDGALPVPAQIVVVLSQFLVGNIFYVLGVLVLSVLAFGMVLRTAKGGEAWDEWVLRSPVIGQFLQKQSIAAFTRVTGIMLAAEVAILDALQVGGKAAGNVAIERDVSAVRSGIAAGRSMAAGLANSRVIPKMVCQMVSTGENTGALDSMLIKIADYYDAEVDLAAENVRLLMQCLLGIVVCVLVAGMAAALYLRVVGS